MADLPTVPTYLQPQLSAPQQFQQWLGVGGSIAGAAQAIQDRQQAEAQAKADAEKAAELEALRQKAVTGNAQARADYITRLNPQAAEQASKAFGNLTEEEQKDKLSQGGQVIALIKSGNLDLAAQRMKDQATALENANGDPSSIQHLRDLADHVKENPNSTLEYFTDVMSVLPGGVAVIEQLNKNDKNPHDINNVDADTLLKLAQARKLELDNLKPGGVDLTPTQVNNRDQAVLDAVKGKNIATQYDALAEKIGTVPLSGAAAGGWEWVKKTLGSQDAVTAIKTEFERLKTSGVLSMLPPGAASDRDIEIARGAFPPTDASPKLIADFMKSMARLKRFDANVADAQAEWVTNNGGLGNARSEFTVDGKPVKPGMKFSDFVAKQIGYESGTLGAGSTPAASPAGSPAIPPDEPPPGAVKKKG